MRERNLIEIFLDLILSLKLLVSLHHICHLQTFYALLVIVITSGACRADFRRFSIQFFPGHTVVQRRVRTLFSAHIIINMIEARKHNLYLCIILWKPNCTHFQSTKCRIFHFSFNQFIFKYSSNVDLRLILKRIHLNFNRSTFEMKELISFWRMYKIIFLMLWNQKQGKIAIVFI